MIQTLKSNKTGPNLVIMAGVHGDEPCGLQAFADVLPALSLSRGTVSFVLGNPNAIAIHKREFHTNLNRLFRSDDALSLTEKSTYEYQRSRELMPLLSQADALLDIHSSTTDKTEPFIICESQSYQCASYLPADTVVSGIDVLHPTGTDAYVNQSGGLGICIECGNHTDNTAKTVAVKAIHNFLQFFEVLDNTNAVPAVKIQRYIHSDWLYRNQAVFTLRKSFSEFESLKKGDVIGIDGQTEIIAPHDGCIMFPHNRNTPGAEAFIFGKSQQSK